MKVIGPEYEQQLINEIKNMPVEYLPGLLQIVQIFRKTIEIKPAEESFEQGWKEAMEGDVALLEDMWVGIDAE